VKAKLRDGRKEAIAVNEAWAMDFVHDQLVTGRKLRVLTVVDTFSRFSPVVDPRFSYKGENVVRTLDQACKIFGYPKSIRTDNGPEFVSRDLDLWAYQTTLFLTSLAPASQPIMHLSSRSTASSELNA
jgi:putative transposase